VQFYYSFKKSFATKYCSDRKLYFRCWGLGNRYGDYMVKITQFQYTFVQNIILLYKTSLQKTVPVQIDDYDYQTKI